MGYAVMQIEDDHLEEHFMVVGVTEDHVCYLAAEYLRLVRPYKTDGTRLVVPENERYFDWISWLDEALTDVDSVRVTTWNTDRGDLLPAGQFLSRLADNAKAFGRMHDR